jgi:hypothetical protein
VGLRPAAARLIAEEFLELLAGTLLISGLAFAVSCSIRVIALR